MDRPEVPYLLAGTIAIAGGAAREGGWPQNGVKAVVAMLVLVLVASAVKGTQAGRLMAAFGWLLVMAAVYVSVPAFGHAPTKKTVKK